MFDCYLAFHNYSWNVSIKKLNLLMDQKLLDIMKKLWIHGCCYFLITASVLVWDWWYKKIAKDPTYFYIL